MKNILLTFEYNKVDEKIEVHANEHGLKFLINELEGLLKEKKNLHFNDTKLGGR